MKNRNVSRTLATGVLASRAVRSQNPSPPLWSQSLRKSVRIRVINAMQKRIYRGFPPNFIFF